MPPPLNHPGTGCVSSQVRTALQAAMHSPSQLPPIGAYRAFGEARRRTAVWGRGVGFSLIRRCVMAARGLLVGSSGVTGEGQMRVLAMSRRLAVVAVVAGFGLVSSPGASAAPSSYFTGAGIGAMTTSRGEAAAAPLPDGRVLIAGGQTAGDQHVAPLFLASAEVFNPATGAFSGAGVGSMSASRAGAAAAPLPDGRVLIAGGYYWRTDPKGLERVVLASAEAFDPATGAFSSVNKSMRVARFGAAAAPLPDGRVLIAGGETGAGGLSSAEVFDPATGAFSSVNGSMSAPRAGAAA